jgi:hypothetical protein
MTQALFGKMLHRPRPDSPTQPDAEESVEA